MNEQDIPIDIGVRKLLDWLISRRICNRDWPQKVEHVRSKIRDALMDMPEHPDMKELLVSSQLNYFTCLRIVDILKETEKDTKNFFGSYGSQRMKDWKEIISQYENENIYLAEVAQTIIQNVVYEIPGIKKHNLKLESLQTESQKKQEAARKRITELENEYRKQCEQLGIDGNKIKSEILALARELPDSYNKIAADAKQIKEAVDVYRKFVQDNLDEGVEIKVLDNVKFLIDEGNVTTYQWKHGEKPVTIEHPSWDLQDEEETNEDNNGIDFGDDDGQIDFGDDTAGDDDGIDFGDEGQIDFGGDDVGEIDFGEDVSGEIDFGDGVVLELDNVDTSAIVVEEGGIQGGVARDDEALSLLDNRRTRTLILDELEELIGFLKQRIVENENTSMKFDMLSGAEAQDVGTLTKLLADVEGLQCSLTEVRVQHLQMIRDSPSYADRLVDSFKQKLRLKEKVVMSIDVLNDRIQDADLEKVAGIQQIKKLQDLVKSWSQHVEKDISKRYKNRKVTITGN